MGDLPDEVGAVEQALKLVAAGDGEAADELGAPGPVEFWERGAELLLQARAGAGGEAAGGDGVAQQRNVTIVVFSHMVNM